jgi:competence protein ComEA
MHIPVLFALLAGAATAATPPPAPVAAAGSARIAREKKPPKAKMTGVLNINRASEAELRLLPGVGRGRAHAIVERRAKRPFSSLEELARMKRMKTVVQKNRAHLSVEGETTLRPAGP